MIMSESTVNIFPALIKARADIQAVQRDKDGFGYKYATLDNVLNMLKDVLPSYDLGFVQFPETIDGKDGVTTVIIHKSGEYISARYEMDATPVKGTNLTQQKGASITYTRRYSLCSVFGIATEEDTDGVVAGQPQTKETKPAVKKTVAEYMALIDNCEDEQAINRLFYEWSKVYLKGTPEYNSLSNKSFERKKQIVGA